MHVIPPLNKKRSTGRSFTVEPPVNYHTAKPTFYGPDKQKMYEFNMSFRNKKRGKKFSLQGERINITKFIKKYEDNRNHFGLDQHHQGNISADLILQDLQPAEHTFHESESVPIVINEGPTVVIVNDDKNE